MTKKINANPTNVEFGNEFGDLNAVKVYEMPFASSKDVKKKSKKKKPD